ncbi:MAG: 2-oxoacid:acceptor oxidoreductase family protein [Candidatus Omnitrophica bacterium]|nr:2-oxoacid:acceptor oxidoreductase family protein [Candidatus Omnitrophota bacterium]
MTERIIIAGAGGQGIMLSGKILAEAAMQEGKCVTWLPAYGPEVRGGTAYCMVIISDSQIGSPYITEADTLIILNGLSFQKFKSRVKKNGLIIANSSFELGVSQKGARSLRYPFTDLAIKQGNVKVANMIALGSYLGYKTIIATKTIFETIRRMAPADKKELIEINRQAFMQGLRLAQ